MKTSSVLASVLFGSFAVAAPFDKRALVYKTEVVTETVVVYTTVYDDDEPAQATTSLISSSSSAVNITTSTDAPAYTAPAPVPAPETSSSSVYVAPPQAPAPTTTSVYVAPPQAPAPTPTPAPVETPEPAPVVPVPAPSSTYVEPAPPVYSAPPAPPAPAPSAAPAPPSNGGGGGAGQHSAEITIYDLPKKPLEGDYGACGTKLNEEDMVVALSAGLMGASTYELATGKATNKWCGQWIEVFYQGNSIKAQIMDKCPGCTHDSDIDLSYSAWKALTGKDEKTRLVASWSPVAA